MCYILQPIGDEFKTRFSISRDDCSYVRLNMGNVHRGRTNGGAWITGLIIIILRFARNLWLMTLYSNV